MRFFNINSVTHRFSDAEYDAIFCVLPLPTYDIGADNRTNRAVSAAADKIRRHDVTFTGSNMNIIATAVELSVQLLSGKRPDLLQEIEQDTQWLSEMRKNFFVLNRLCKEFQELQQEYG